jgi:hypothetical protein
LCNGDKRATHLDAKITPQKTEWSEDLKRTWLERREGAVVLGEKTVRLSVVGDAYGSIRQSNLT